MDILGHLGCRVVRRAHLAPRVTQTHVYAHAHIFTLSHTQCAAYTREHASLSWPQSNAPPPAICLNPGSEEGFEGSQGLL